MTEETLELAEIIMRGLVGVLIVFVIVLIVLLLKQNQYKSEKKQKIKKETTNNKNHNQGNNNSNISNISVFDFMEFDTIDDNMIIRKNGKKYIMAIECQGINYDLMSRVEKDSVESGFIQFLNTLRYPIQLYIQTRTVDLEGSISLYKSKVENLQREMEKNEIEYAKMKNSDLYTESQKNKALYEYTRKKNLYEYGQDVIRNTMSMSLNSNVLRKKYYIIISYSSEETENTNLSKSEIKERAFSELYTRAQALISSIAVCGVHGKMLDSFGLAELLYNSYNRDEAETYGMDKAIQAQYSELYTTAPDIMERKVAELNKQIESEAIKMAADRAKQVKYAKEEEYKNMKKNKEDLIYELALEILDENSEYVGEDVAEEAKKSIKKEQKKKGGKKSEEK